MVPVIRKNYSIIILLFFLPLIVLATAAHGERQREAELFETAYEYYLSSQPQKAIEAFDAFLIEFPDSLARDSVMFWKAKALAQIGKTSEARSVFKELMSRYPESPYSGFAAKELESLQVAAAQKQDTKTADAADERKPPRTEIAASGPASRTLQENALHKALADRDEFEKLLKEEREKNMSFRLHAEKVRDLESENRRLTEEISKLQQSISDRERSAAQDKESFKEAIEAEKLKLINLQKTQEALEARLSRADSSSADRQKEQEALRQAQAEREALDQKVRALEKAQLSRAAEHEQKVAQLSADLGAAVQDRGRLQGVIAQRDITIQGLDARLGELEARAAAKGQTQKEVQALEAELKKRDARLEEFNRTKASLEGQLASARSDQERFSSSYVKIFGKTYSLKDFYFEENIALSAIKKANLTKLLWRTGDLIQNGITTELLYHEAKRRGIVPDRKELDSLFKKIGSDEHEHEYLKKALSVNGLIMALDKEAEPGEAELRAYYNANREQFLEKTGSKQVAMLAIRYSPENELERAVMALEATNEASAGKTFNEIMKSMKGIASLKRSDMSKLPSWLQDKIRQLPEGGWRSSMRMTCSSSTV